MRPIDLCRVLVASALGVVGCASEVIEPADTTSSSDGAGGDGSTSNGADGTVSDGAGSAPGNGNGNGGEGSGGDGPPAPPAHLLVTSQSGGSVKEFDEAGAFVRSIGGSIEDPLDAEVAPDGTILVTDGRESEVVRFTRDGTPLDAFARVGTPFGMLVDGSTVYVCDNELGAVRAFDILSGDEVGSFVVGVGAWLNDVAVYDGKLFATEWNGGTVEVFDRETGAPRGALISGVPGIIAIAIGPDGDIYLSQLARTGSVRRHDSVTGEFVAQVVGDGDPTLGVAIGPDGLLYVATGSSGVRRFGLDGSGGEYFIEPESGGLQNPYHITFVPPP